MKMFLMFWDFVVFFVFMDFLIFIKFGWWLSKYLISIVDWFMYVLYKIVFFDFDI